MAIPRSEAARQPAVRVRGIVSMVGDGLAGTEKRKEQVLSSFCMEDESAGIYVAVSQARRDEVWAGANETLRALHEGSEIEIDGVLDAGAFAPVIVPRSLRVLGEKVLPPARVVPLAQLMNGAADVQRVQVSGVVQSIADEAGRRWLLKVETGLGHFLARLPKMPAFTPARLLDAASSVCACSVRNFHRPACSCSVPRMRRKTSSRRSPPEPAATSPRPRAPPNSPPPSLPSTPVSAP